MSRQGKRTLDEEERVLWTLVARTATPLRGRTAPEPVAAPSPAMPEPPAASPAPLAVAAAPPSPPRQQRVGHSLDRQTLTKLTQEKLPIEGRVDLHGMTQGEAHGLLFSFLQRAHAGGVRYVLVITGKGSSSGGDGILRRAVPAWLSTPLFRPFVSGYDHAARGHGGSGALYVRLRRRERVA
jgi:DNA-nicking Smr family endonuclease